MVKLLFIIILWHELECACNELFYLENFPLIKLVIPIWSFFFFNFCYLLYLVNSGYIKCISFHINREEYGFVEQIIHVIFFFSFGTTNVIIDLIIRKKN
jgi:hypothetical protein